MTLTDLLRSQRAKVEPLALGNTAAAGCVKIFCEELQPIADALKTLDFEAMAHQFLEQHKPEPGGCTCGFCNWSVEHVLIMFAQECAKQTGRILGK